jgi:hypothetical protein
MAVRKITDPYRRLEGMRLTTGFGIESKAQKEK